MSGADEDPTPPADLSDALIRRIDSLALSELKSVLAYVEQRIESLRTPIEAEIDAEAGGEVVDVEDHGAYALVRKHPPNPDGPGVNTEITSLYHVSKEPHVDETESLHWTYLGDVHNAEQIRCETCGRILDSSVTGCPHCESDDVDRTETEE